MILKGVRLLKIFLMLFLIVFTFFMTIYGGYYLINPSHRGEEILDSLNIPYPPIIAHRGASYIAPESTKPAYLHAKNVGVDYLEADIHRTKDDQLVVFHDSNLKRTSNIRQLYPERVNDHISTFTYQKLLQLDYGFWFNNKYPKRSDPNYIGLKILRLEDLLKIAGAGNSETGIILDIKDPEKYPGIEDDIITCLDKYNLISYKKNNNNEKKINIIIFSRDLAVLKKFKEKAPQLPRTLLLNNTSMSKRNWSNWLKIADGNVDGLGVKGFISWPWLTAMAHDRNLFVFSYVIDYAWQLKIMAHIKTNGYITNRPEFVLKFFDLIPKITEIINK